MKEEEKAQGELRTYLRQPIFSAVLLILMTISIYISNWETGLLVFFLALIFGSICLQFYAVSGAEIDQATIDFSTATGSMQMWLTG